MEGIALRKNKADIEKGKMKEETETGRSGAKETGREGGEVSER